MRNPLAVVPWRQAVVTVVGLPLVVTLAVLAYAWPAARIAPRHVPVGVVGTAAAARGAAEGLQRGAPGGFDVHRYPDQAAARSAIEHRDVYGAFVVGPGGVTVLQASAAGPSVAQLLDASGSRLAASAAAPAAVRTVDVVPVSAHDPRGLVFSSALLPLTICGVLVALVVTMSGAVMPGRRRLVALVTASAAGGLAALLVAQGFLGALPHEHAATWAGLALTVLAVAAPTAGLVTLVGRAGLGMGAVLMVFVGNPFSGSTSAPELLPTAVGDIGRWLPPGAGANLLRGTAYFGGSGSAGPLAVLAVWIVLGLAAVASGRPSPADLGDHLVAEGGGQALSRASLTVVPASEARVRRL
nr:ABC transporter permease [Streptomyces sp. NBC_00899]